MPNCYYYDEQRNHCKCYVNENLNELMAENAKLREQMERLVTLLRVDWDIDVSWDGLRRFWNIGLTDNGCLMRDRACKAEAENTNLRKLVRILAHCAAGHGCDICPINGGEGLINILDMCESVHDRMRELGVEVE